MATHIVEPFVGEHGLAKPYACVRGFDGLVRDDRKHGVHHRVQSGVALDVSEIALDLTDLSLQHTEQQEQQ